MQIQTETRPWTDIEADWLIVGVAESDDLSGPLATLNDRLNGQLRRLQESKDLTGKLAELLPIRDVPDIAASRLLLVGLGKAGDLDIARFNKAMMTAARQISDKRDIRVAVGLPKTQTLTQATCAQAIATAMQVGSVGQDLYRSEASRFPFQSVTLLMETAAEDLQAAVSRGQILGEAINLTRELVNRPAHDIFPISFAERARQVADEYGMECQIFDEEQLKNERMNTMLAVAGGSAQPPRMVVLEYRGAGSGHPVLALCGKGVTFDSGGLSLKTSQGMTTMKSDMAGAATVLGAITAIARLKLPINVTALMGLVENMPSATAYKVGDVLTARNGTTIEVLNTDAEGRLVLADVMSYAVDQEGTDKIIDLATLTGACVVALGEEVTGVFSNNQPWCDELREAAKRVGEDVWQMPMFGLYADLLNSDIADVKNIGGRWGGAITAAKFLEKFVGNKPWIHLDIAGPAFASGNKPHREGGATGCMVRTLVEVAEKTASPAK